jgi:uncharacterized protein (UPF0332 family)
MLEQRDLDRAPVDADTVSALLASARRHIASAGALIASDLEGSYALAYDAARKSATALLAHQGLRPTSSGGHIVVVDAMRVQFPDVPGLRSIDMLRRRRNQTEYPDPRGVDPIRPDEIDEAIATAREALDAVERLLEVPQLGLF